MSAHAEFGPSAADRWMVCTGSSALIKQMEKAGLIKPDEGSEYAAEGTVAHEIRERCLRDGTSPFDYIGEEIQEGKWAFTVDEEMAECILPGVEWLRNVLLDIDIEIRVRLDPWLPGQFGTMDSGGIMDRGETLLVCDYKHGQGEPVDAVGNRQMRWYALGYWHYLGRPKVKNILMVIDQPRAGGMKFWEISLQDLLDFGEEGARIFIETKKGNTSLNPTRKGCRWCRARMSEASCRAYDDWMAQFYAEWFDEGDGQEEPRMIEPLFMTPERRYEIVKHADLIKQWLAKLHEESLAAAIDGKPDPGSKAVMGRAGARFFADEEKARQILWDAVGLDAYKPLDLIGIGEAEKLLKPGRRKKGHPEAWNSLQMCISQNQGRPVLADENDPRPEVTSLVDQFEDLDDTEDLDKLL